MIYKCTPFWKDYSWNIAVDAFNFQRNSPFETLKTDPGSIYNDGQPSIETVFKYK